MRFYNHQIGGHGIAPDAGLCVLAFFLFVCAQGCIGYFVHRVTDTAYAEGTWTGTLAEVSRDSVAIDPSDKTGGSVLVLEVSSHPPYEKRDYRSGEIRQDAPPVEWKVAPRRLLLTDDETGEALVEQNTLRVGSKVTIEGNYNGERFIREGGDQVSITGHPSLDGVLYVSEVRSIDAADEKRASGSVSTF